MGEIKKAWREKGKVEEWREKEGGRGKGGEDGRSCFLDPKNPETSKRLKEHNHKQGMDLV